MTQQEKDKTLSCGCKIRYGQVLGGYKVKRCKNHPVRTMRGGIIEF